MQLSSKTGHRSDYFLFALIIVLVVFGLTMLASASSDLGKNKFNDSYYYIKHQLLYGLSLGVLGFLGGITMPYRYYRRLAFPFLLLSLGGLALVFTSLGITANHASRWIHIGPVSLQPAEIVKLSFILYIAAWLSNPKANREKNLLEGLVPFLIVSGFVALLLFLQPATSTVVIIMAAALAVYLVSGARLSYIIAIILMGAAAIGLLIFITPYRLERVTGFLNTESDALGKNYQRNQALIAIGSGGLWGRGYGQSTTKVGYLPAPIDDSIFAVIAEELGFVGAGSLVILFGTLVFRMFWLAYNVRDRFGKLLLVGFGSVIALQAFVNIASISGLLPLTGVPLPFVSYGGTALAVFMTMGGISLNISKYA